MVDAIRLALAEVFQQDLQIASGGQGLALAQRRALIMLAEPLRFEDAAAQERSNKVAVFLATQHQLDQSEIVRVECEDVLISRNRMEACLPSRGECFDDSGMEDVSVIAKLSHKGAVFSNRYLQALRDSFIYRIEEKVSVCRQLQGLSRPAKVRMIWEQGTGTQDQNLCRAGNRADDFDEMVQ